jgi:hypothetical protein
MKVDPSTPLRGAAPTRRGERAGARDTGFARHLDTAAGGGAAAGAAGIAATGLAGILSLQEVDDATAGRRRAVSRGETLLDRLDALRHGLLLGTLGRPQLRELERLVGLQRDSVADPGLAALLDEIDLRVQVELAKYDVQSDS